MIRVGICGIGFMGWIHWLAYQRVEGIEVRAICSRDPQKRAGDWRGIQGNFGPPGEQVDLTHIRCYEHFADMLSDDKIDLIDVCLPPATHLTYCSQALECGKHVFCEKPLALNVADCNLLMESSRQSGRQLLVGHVLPFFPEYQWALSQINSSQYGEVLGGHFKRVISRPDWIPDFFDLDRVGGPLIDLHVHDAHLICMLFGMPQSVFSRGIVRDNCVHYATTLFGFDDQNRVVSSTSGVIDQPARPFTHAFEIQLEQALLQFELAVYTDGVESIQVKLLDNHGRIIRPKQLEPDPIVGFASEIEEVKQSILKNQRSRILDVGIATQAIQLCQAQSDSVRTNQLVRI